LEERERGGRTARTKVEAVEVGECLAPIEAAENVHGIVPLDGRMHVARGGRLPRRGNAPPLLALCGHTRGGEEFGRTKTETPVAPNATA